MRDEKFLNTNDIAEFLGLSLTKTKQLCVDKPHGFPVTQIGGRYRARRDLLEQWSNDLYAGKFHI